MEALGQSVLDISISIAFLALLAAFALTVYRLLRGPSFADRVVALDMLMLIGIGFITVKAIDTNEYSYIDVAIAMSLVGFLATVAFSRYIYRRAHVTGIKSPNITAENAETHAGQSSDTNSTPKPSGQGEAS